MISNKDQEIQNQNKEDTNIVTDQGNEITNIDQRENQKENQVINDQTIVKQDQQISKNKLKQIEIEKQQKEIEEKLKDYLENQQLDFKNYFDGDSFQKNSFICLLKIIYKNTLDLTYLQTDSYLEEIKQLVKNKTIDNYKLMSLFNVRIINSINNLFIQYSNLNGKIKKEIVSKCYIDISETKKRCENTYKKECFNDLDTDIENPFAFNIKCKDLIPQKSNVEYIRSYGTKCYLKCPLFYKELYNKCEMPQAYENKLFSSLEECEFEKLKNLDPYLLKLIKEHDIQIQCRPYMNYTFYVPQCLPGFQRQFYLFCIPDCPNGMIPSEKYCLKRNPIEIPNNITFTFTDLFLNEVVSIDYKKKIDKQDMDLNVITNNTIQIYRQSMQQKKREIELQNKS